MKRKAKGYWVIKRYRPIKSCRCVPQARIEVNDIWNGVAVSVCVKDEEKLLQAAENMVRMAAKRRGVPAWQLWSQVFLTLASKHSVCLPGEPYREPEWEEVELIDERMGQWR